MKLTLYVFASTMYSYQDDYDPDLPYKIEYDLDNYSSESRWLIGSFEIEFPEFPVGNNMIVDAQILGLEEALKKENASHVRKAMALEDRIAKLTALPAPVEENSTWTPGEDEVEAADDIPF